MRLPLAVPFAALIAIAPPRALASNSRDYQDELLHSDLPLWAENEEMPAAALRSLALGDWRQSAANCAGADPDACTSWLRFRVEGVWHFSFYVQESDEREGLGRANSEVSALVPLVVKSGLRVFALEIGFRPGSRYLLLSAAASDPIKQMSVLDFKCDARGVHPRGAPFATNHVTEYCNVDSEDALRRLARDALNRPPRAMLEWISDKTSDQ